MSRVVLACILAAPLVVMAACGGAETLTEVAVASSDAGGDNDSAAALPPGVDHYHGNVACCAQDAGRCCSDNELCEAYVACDQAGEAWEPKGLYCEECCPGLEPLEVVRQNADGTCDRDAGLELEPDFVCAACGNGVCERTSAENHCSCPADCP